MRRKSFPIPGVMFPTDHYQRQAVEGTKAAQWEKETWFRLESLARNNPEAGIHFQGYSEATAEN